MSLATIPTAVRLPILVVLAVALVVYLLLLALLYKAYQAVAWDIRSDPDVQEIHCRTYDEAVMQEWVARECLTSMRANDLGLRRKARYV